MRQDAPRNDRNPDEGLLDFDREALNSALDTKEPDLDFHRNEPSAAFDGSDPVVIYDRGEPDSAFGREDLDIVFNRQQRDSTSGTRVKIGIALLILGSIGALAWSGLWLMGMRRDAGTSGAQIQNASEPTPTVPPEAPTNVLPPAPDPEPPRARVPAENATPSEPATAIATPSEAPGANAPDTPPTERPARQAERPPVTTDANAAGGLFAITRPLGAQVFLDNKLIGTTPLFVSQVSSGSHEVRLELSGFKTYSSSIQVEPQTRSRLAVQLEGTR